jgi:hypothetical protein
MHEYTSDYAISATTQVRVKMCLVRVFFCVPCRLILESIFRPPCIPTNTQSLQVRFRVFVYLNAKWDMMNDSERDIIYRQVGTKLMTCFCV